MEHRFFFNSAQKRIVETFKSIFKSSDSNTYGLNRLSKYGWYNTLYLAADGDLKKMKELEQMPVYDVFTYINYKIDYQEENTPKKKNN